MATYQELFDLRYNSALKNRIMIACLIAADIVRNEVATTPNHANRLLWAKAVFAAPDYEADRMLLALLAQNNASTIAQITGASDTVLQNSVNIEIDLFATGA